MVIQPDGKIVVVGLASGGLGLTPAPPQRRLRLDVHRRRRDAGPDHHGRPRIPRSPPMPRAVPRCTWPCRTPPASRPTSSWPRATPSTVQRRRRHARRHPAGHLHRQYPGSPATRSVRSNADTRIYDLAIQPDGKIVVVGLGLVVGQDERYVRVRRRLVHRHGGRPGQPGRFDDFTFGNVSSVRHPTFRPRPQRRSGRRPVLNFRFSFSLINTSNVTSPGQRRDADARWHIIVVGTESGTQDGRGPADPGPPDERRVATDQTFAGNRHPAGRDIAQGLDVAYDAQANKIVAIGYANLPDIRPGRSSPSSRPIANGVVDTNLRQRVRHGDLPALPDGQLQSGPQSATSRRT